MKIIKQLLSILRSKPLVSSFLISFIMLVALPSYASKILEFLVRSSIEEEMARINTAVHRNLDSLAEQTKKIAQEETLQPFLLEKNTTDMMISLMEEKKANDLDYLTVTDRNGNVFLRTQSFNFRGDNIFQTTAWGSKFSEKKELKSIEQLKFNPLGLVSGYPLIYNNQTIGALFGGIIIDNQYAEKIKIESLLDPRNQIIFYSRGGVTGGTITDTDTARIINTYLKSIPDLTDAFKKLEEIKIKDQYYLIKNLTFEGVDGKSGGALLLFKNPRASEVIILAFAIALIFFIMGIFLCRRRSMLRRTHHIFVTMCLMFCIFSASFLIIDRQLETRVVDLSNMPDSIENVTMRLYPETDIIDRNFKQQVEIHISSNKEIIDTIQAVVNYDPSKIKITDISTIGSICSQDLIIKTIDNKHGEFSLVCATAKSNFYGSDSFVASLLMQPLTMGHFSLHLSSDSKILSSDSSLNILREANDGFYTIIDSNELSEYQLPVFSFTHPNSNRWYNTKTIVLSWPREENYKYKYALNQNPNYIPDGSLITENNKLELKVEDDGVYYFHLLPYKNSLHGQITHFKINIDSTPPEFINFSTNNSNIKVGDSVRFSFQSDDNLSGVEKGYYIRINNGILLPVRNPFYIPFTAKGDYKLTARINDNAGNYNERSEMLRVSY